MRAIELIKKKLGVNEAPQADKSRVALERSMFGSTLAEEEAYWNEVEKNENERLLALAAQKTRLEEQQKRVLT